MKVKILQADTRPIRLYLQSRNLVYTPVNKIDLQRIAEHNNGLLFPNEPNSLATTVNLMKSKMLGFLYEFRKGNLGEWEEGNEKSVTWIKIRSLLEDLDNPSLKDVDVFCFIDTDAWIRDEHEFLKFCESFLASSHPVAIPRDIEQDNASFLNTGFIAVKNCQKAKEILQTVYSHSDYRSHEKLFWWEQSELSTYQEKHPEDILVLPLNDFNTPCGRIVRHCWVKHLIESLVIQDVIACFSKLAVQFTNDPNITLGQGVQFLCD